jgi:hypothetical protein
MQVFMDYSRILGFFIFIEEDTAINYIFIIAKYMHSSTKL